MELYLVKGYSLRNLGTCVYGAFTIKDIALSVKRTLEDHLGADENVEIEELNVDKVTKDYYLTVED